MTDFYILGLDVGRNVGVSRIRLDSQQRFWWELDDVFSDVEAPALIDTMLCDPQEPVDLVAVELPQGYVHHAARGPELLRAAKVGGALVQVAKARGIQVVETNATEVRKALCRRPNAGDAEVKMMVYLRVIDWPKISNSHQRDAAAAAVFAGLRHMMPAELRAHR